MGWVNILGRFTKRILLGAVVGFGLWLLEDGLWHGVGAHDGWAATAGGAILFAVWPSLRRSFHE